MKHPRSASFVETTKRIPRSGAIASVLMLASLSAVSCTSGSRSQAPATDLDAIARHVEAGETDAALLAVRQLLESGHATPSDLLADPRFRSLRDDPQPRAQLRELMAEHARPASIVMVDPEEPGTPLQFDFTVLDDRTGEPLAGVHVLFTQVDIEGLYQPSDLDRRRISWNPRLFGHATTDDRGTVSVRTIRPAHYHPHYAADEPAHIHFTLTKDGYRTWGGEMFFEDDPRVDASVRAEAQRHGTPILKTSAAADGTLHAIASVRLQPE